MFAANGKLLMQVCTLGNGHPIGTQNTTRADIPADDDNVMPAPFSRRPGPSKILVPPNGKNELSNEMIEAVFLYFCRVSAAQGIKS
jgi:hypothetical protein